MGFTGLIFGAIAAAWLIYLVPYFLRQRGVELVEDIDPAIPFSGEVTIVRSGGSLAEADPGAADISTPLTRRAKLNELKLLDIQAAQRRRRVLIFLLAVQIVVAALAAVGVGAWWAALVPSGLIAGFLVIARFSVRAMRADFDRRAQAIRGGEVEETVALSLNDLDVASRGHSIELSVPITTTGSLWDPVPITRPTYVSTPLAPRTVRTIDLSAPVVAPGAAPVTADPITEPAAEPTIETRQEDVG
ncbi:MAG: hypothetical protein CVT62_04035 [Actinobacteria bacterium HGW-Actinobacteria-2]|nr:MAG: hypothetical protein CVT62_04035 [Actinobacteria bacterium HGW-Actinobacteria-2]